VAVIPPVSGGAAKGCKVAGGGWRVAGDAEQRMWQGGVSNQG